MTAAAVPFVIAVPPASAATGVGSIATFPATTRVGLTNQPASLALTNVSTRPQNVGNETVTNIDLVPACGTQTFVAATGDCPTANADPGVISISPTGTGGAGTACAGVSFTVSIIDPVTGQVQFNPPVASPVVLSPPATTDSLCIIDFTFDVPKAPTMDVGGGPSGSVTTAQNAHASGNVSGILSNGNAASTMQVELTGTDLDATATSSATVGGAISDTATLTGAPSPAPSPTGSIAFAAYGPSDTACSHAPAFASNPVTVTGTGTYTSTPSFTPIIQGSYLWVAYYSGDANYIPNANPCGGVNQTSTVNKASPSLVTSASASVPVGGSISDSAVLTGGFSPTGSITFDVYGPGDSSCGTVVFTSSTTVVGNGTYASATFTPAAAGTYVFEASYSGDAANNAIGPTACSNPGEATSVTEVTPTIVTTASSTTVVGGIISDSAVLAGGVDTPTGTITFDAYANSTCTGTPTFTSSTTVSGNGTYTSSSFTTTLAGTYNFVADYSGDANNNPVTSVCGATGESVVVAKATPLLVTSAPPSAAAGAAISDSAVLASQVPTTGAITFTLFGPNNATCTGTPIFTSIVTVTAGNDDYTSGSFTTTAVGTYHFQATYSGDANNNAVVPFCPASNQSVVVTPAAPTIVTHASASVPAGGTVSDTATLASGVAPSGTVTFTVFGPNNATCTGTPIFTSTGSVTSGNGNYTSSSFTVTLAGTYNFVDAYSGDANNSPVTSACGATNESVVVSPAVPTIVTHASASVAASGLRAGNHRPGSNGGRPPRRWPRATVGRRPRDGARRYRPVRRSPTDRSPLRRRPTRRSAPARSCGTPLVLGPRRAGPA